MAVQSNRGGISLVGQINTIEPKRRRKSNKLPEIARYYIIIRANWKKDILGTIKLSKL